MAPLRCNWTAPGPSPLRRCTFAYEVCSYGSVFDMFTSVEAEQRALLHREECETEARKEHGDVHFTQDGVLPLLDDARWRAGVMAINVKHQFQHDNDLHHVKLSQKLDIMLKAREKQSAKRRMRHGDAPKQDQELVAADVAQTNCNLAVTDEKQTKQAMTVFPPIPSAPLRCRDPDGSNTPDDLWSSSVSDGESETTSEKGWKFRI